MQRAVIDQERKDNSIQNYVKDSALPYIDVEIKNVILDDLRQSPYSARIEFEKVYSNPADHSELKRERFGLTIVRFRADQAFNEAFIDLRRGLFMSFHAANPADFRHLSRCLVEQASKSFSTCNYGGKLRPSHCGYASSNRIAIAVNFRSQCADEVFALACVCRYVSRLLLGHSFGAFPAPGGTRSSASHCAPLRGLGSSQNKFENHGKERLSNFFRVPPRKQTFGTWEPGPLAKLRPV